MRAALYRAFQEPLTIESVDDPDCPSDGVVLEVKANGVCRSDWHGWMGHDPDIRLPHVPGHELTGVVAAVGRDCEGWAAGDRAAAPFILGCGRCPSCAAGQPQVCDDQAQPGFTYWGGFAEYVAIPRARLNLVRLPESLGFVEAASLGCRFTTAFRAAVEQGRLRAGEWLAVHGCGGVGLSAVMIAKAAGAQVAAVDVDPQALAAAQTLGAGVLINARSVDDVPAAVREATGGGAHVSLDALGHRETCRNSILCLRTQGRHVQVGLLAGGHKDPPLPMGRVIARELELIGSHGMAAHRFPQLFEMIAAGALDPARLVTQRLSLEDGAALLMRMGEPGGAPHGVAVIDRF
ncbi:MAG: zinc-dependent alcohol dehydrogenase family protein [Marivibrio sp.]|uniref:zinc-dependent alcohol dehydrogenase family protein n=1 Tax=Marivibrio sp. TaxID=2039719 RepID=UPI0032EB73E7